MSATHFLKCHPEPYQAIVDGRKTHEFRKDDREIPYSVGDHLEIEEWDPTTESFTGRSWSTGVTYLSRGPDWGIPEGYVCMSLDVSAAYFRRRSRKAGER